jgi:hypothetical protein
MKVRNTNTTTIVIQAKSPTSQSMPTCETKLSCTAMTHKPLTRNQIQSKCPKPAGRHPKHNQMILANPTTQRLTNPKMHTNNQTPICAPHKPKRAYKRGIYKSDAGSNVVIERRMSKIESRGAGVHDENAIGNPSRRAWRR